MEKTHTAEDTRERAVGGPRFVRVALVHKTRNMTKEARGEKAEEGLYVPARQLAAHRMNTQDLFAGLW